MMITNTNIKNLPQNANYFTEHLYTDARVWVEVKRTATTVTLAEVVTKKDPDWKPDFHVGGFAAHCANQSQQTWLFDRINYDATRTVRMTKRGWAYKGTKFSEGKARRFYDYNF